MRKNITLEKIRTLNKETKAGLLFCYKALKKFGDDQQAFDYLMSDKFRNSINTMEKEILLM